MSVAVTQVLQPTGVTGPPDVMAAFTTLTGDGSGGTNTITITIDAGFLWMINFVCFGHNVAGALEFAMILDSSDDLIAVGSQAIRHNGTLAAGSALANTELFVWPRSIFSTSLRDATLLFQVPNVNLEVSQLYARLLRWRKNDPPAAWQAFMVGPH